MRTIELGNTGEQVSSLCLGTMYFGSAIDDEQSFRLLDQYMDAGGNFLDTANNYAFWIDGFQGGESEKLLGRWIQARDNRNDIFLATKVGYNMPPRIPNNLSRQTIIEHCENSLRHLQTDVIDLYYAHTDHRATPLEETLAAFDELVQAGKVRYIGCSNILAWRIAQAHAVSAKNGLPSYVCVQQRDSYLRPRGYITEFGNSHIPVTSELLDYAETHADTFTIIAYSTLLGGVYASETGDIPENYQPHQYDDALKRRKLSVLREIAAEVGATPNQVVIAWLTQNTPAMIALISSSSQERLQENLDADKVTLSAENIERLNSVV